MILENNLIFYLYHEIYKYIIFKNTYTNEKITFI